MILRETSNSGRGFALSERPSNKQVWFHKTLISFRISWTHFIFFLFFEWNISFIFTFVQEWLIWVSISNLSIVPFDYSAISLFMCHYLLLITQLIMVLSFAFWLCHLVIMLENFIKSTGVPNFYYKWQKSICNRWLALVITKLKKQYCYCWFTRLLIW